MIVTAKQVTAADRIRFNGNVSTVIEKSELDAESFAAEVRRAISGPSSMGS